MTEAIRTEHLKFSYDAQSESGGVTVFDDLNLSIEEGSFVAVLGHNGCGKSTLAKHFNAVLLPEGGSVQVFGMDTSDESLLVDIRRTVGMVFQNPDNQMVANVVEEDVAFAPENLGVPSEEIRRRVDEALKQVRRVAIAGVIAMRPRCIVLDEPTAMLDPHGREEVISTIERLNREMGITVVLITHHMTEAIRAQRVIVMDAGRILADGTPKEVFPQVELLESVGLTVPATTKVLYALNQAGFDLPLDALSTEECAQVLLAAIGAKT